MRVLWFTNTPSLAAKLLNYDTVTGGWIDSLEMTIAAREDIELAVAFQFDQVQPQKLIGKHSTYYLVPHKQSIVRKLISRHFQISQDDRDIRHYLNIIEDFKPDVIQIFGTENNYGLIADKTEIPVIIHLQGILSIIERKWFVSGLSQGYLAMNSGLKRFLFGSSWLHNYRLFKKAARRERLIFSRTRNFMGRTDWDRRICRILSPGANYYPCEEMMRPLFYEIKWAKVPQNEKMILSTIHQNVYKGLETVLDTGCLLKQAGLIDFEWRIAGIRENDPFARLVERFMGFKFADNNIRLLGSLKPDELAEEMLQADVFVHPSHIDNSPNSVCEAMLAGMPVIATFTGGTGSLLKDREEGLLIQDGDPYALAGALTELLQTPGLAVKLGQNAHERAVRRHDPNEIALNLISIYRQLTGKDN